MKAYAFYTATELTTFIDEHRDKIIGQTLNNVYTSLGNCYIPYRDTLLDEPIIFCIGEGFAPKYIVVDYYIPSNMKIRIASREEICQEDLEWIITLKLKHDEDEDRGDRTPLRKDIKNHKITDIRVKKFSSAFEIDPVYDTMRIDGGDYFSTVSLTLDNGLEICVCGADALSDGYALLWAKQ